MSEKKQTVDLGLLEEDDEFEEFPAEGKFRRQQFNVTILSWKCFSHLVVFFTLYVTGYATVTQLA